MKKLMIVLGVALFTMASCSKDYTCKCTVTEAGVEIGSTSSTITGKKKDVTAACDANDASVGTLSTNCEIQ
ncbi:MAG: hypothetical protein K9I25_06090 [Crocinitomicaceae bacterium]|jgi:hypothetical protein|nr:hypothetical protein [Crocinitomicaceae bacterium]